MDETTKQRFQIERELREAIPKGQLRLYLQPQVDANGKTVREQQVQQRSPAAPSDTLQTTQKTIDIVVPKGQGVSTESHTVQGSNGNGGLQTVWVDTNTTQKAQTVNVDTKTAAGAKPEAQSQSKTPPQQTQTPAQNPK